MAQSPPSCSWTPWFGCCPVLSVTTNRPENIGSASDHWIGPHARYLLNFVVGKYRTFCFPEITLLLLSGGRNRRSNAQDKIAPICSINPACVQERYRR